MTMDEPVAPSMRRTLHSAPSLAMDLSWVISVAVRPQWRPKFPAVFEHLAGRKELVERVRTFWSDCDHDTCFTEMQVLAHHAGALEETSPSALWAALEGAIVHRADRHRAGVRVTRGSPHLPRTARTPQGVTDALPFLHGSPPRGVGAHRRDLAARPPHAARGRSPGGGGDGERADARRGDAWRILRDLQGQAGRHHPAHRLGLPPLGGPLPLLRQQPLPGVPGSHRSSAPACRGTTRQRGPAPSRWRGASRRWPTRPAWPSCTTWPGPRARWAIWPRRSAWPNRRSACT